MDFTIKEKEKNMNDKMKHRIVGIVVIAAFLVILLPALMKKDNEPQESLKQSVETSYAPDERPVTGIPEPVSSEPQNFQANEVAPQASLDQPASNPQPAQPAPEALVNQAPKEASVESMNSMESMESIDSKKAPEPVAKPKPVSAPAPKPVVIQPKPKPQPVVVKKAPAPVPPKPVTRVVNTNVCFQLGTFTNPSNAQSLVTRLKAQGFSSAKTTPVLLANGKTVQRVSLCKAMSHSEALIARAKLAKLVGTTPIMTR